MEKVTLRAHLAQISYHVYEMQCKQCSSGLSVLMKPQINVFVRLVSRFLRVMFMPGKLKLSFLDGSVSAKSCCFYPPIAYYTTLAVINDSKLCGISNPI